jgi:AAHS family 4-hydroxybenzoate transporter-like MFS transporter
LVAFLFYVIPAIIGALAAFLFVKKETKGKSIDQLAQETTFSLN